MRVLSAHRLFLALLFVLALTTAALEGECEVVRLYVGPETIECVGVAAQKCLLVTTDPTEPAQAFYDHIDGFEHQEGTTYVLDVLVEPVEDPPADASSLAYTLVDVVEELPGGSWSDFGADTDAASSEAHGDVEIVSDEEWCALFHRGAGDCVSALPMTTSMGGLVPASWATALGASDLATAPDERFCALFTGEIDACLAVLAPDEPPLYLPATHAEYTLAEYLPAAE